MLKALVVQRTEKFPPRIHDLGRLAELASLDLRSEQRKFLGNLSFYYIETRYPEEVSKLASEIGDDVASAVLDETKEFVSWLERQLG